MKAIRVRFAPSPTGFMHLGNVRAALMNYLFAKQQRGTFILRVEDTDQERNFDEAKKRILVDLEWLGLDCQEGPHIGGDFGPYEQSLRTNFYKEKLEALILLKKAYKCFCTPEELESMRKAQLAAGNPPRYNRTCLMLSSAEITSKDGAPFVWRFKIDETKSLPIPTMNGSEITFNMEHFSDFVLSRSDGSFTFIFVNFVDDWLMQISHVIRGEDHLSNTALQAALYDTFKLPTPIFWHLPIICNEKGEKLSKRDFGFSLTDLRNAGFVPEAITNYLATMGISLPEEIQSLETLTDLINFSKFNVHGGIQYNLEKLLWFNQKWLSKIELNDFISRAKPFVLSFFNEKTLAAAGSLDHVYNLIRPEAKTLADTPKLIQFYLEEPTLNRDILFLDVPQEKVKTINNLIKSINFDHESMTILESLKKESKEYGISTKELLITLRFALTGATKGLGIHDLFSLLKKEVISNRLRTLEKIL